MENSSEPKYRQTAERQASELLSSSDESSSQVHSELSSASDGELTSIRPRESLQNADALNAMDASEATIISQKPLQNGAAAGPARKNSSASGVTAVMAAAQVLTGKSLDHFELQELIGGGGMGAVFRARDTRLDRIVAVKVIPAAGQDADMARRFKVEAQSAARLDHPNIARVYYVGEVGDWSYIVFEYVDGINLRDLVISKGPLSIDEAVWFTRQVAEALTHASARFVVHRDIKPSNVLVTKRGLIKLVDMGLARTTAIEKTTNDLTASNITLGTFDYISPEQARDPRAADVRSDLYSLGCTLYFLLSGKPPFPDGTAIQKLLMHGNVKPTDIRRLRIDVTDELAAIVNKLMEKNPGQRYQQPIELINDLYLLAEFESLPKSRQAGTISITPTIEGKTVFESLLPWMVVIGLLCGVILWMQNMHRVKSLISLPREKVAFTFTPTSNVVANNADSQETNSSQSKLESSSAKPNNLANGTTKADATSAATGVTGIASSLATSTKSTVEAGDAGGFQSKVDAASLAKSGTLDQGTVGTGNAMVKPTAWNSALPASLAGNQYMGPFTSKLPDNSVSAMERTSPDFPPRLPTQGTSLIPQSQPSSTKEDMLSVDRDSIVVVDPSGMIPNGKDWTTARSLQDALLIASAEPQRNQIILMGTVRVANQLTWTHPSIIIRSAAGQRAKLQLAPRSDNMPSFNGEGDELTSGFRLGSQSLQLMDVDIELTCPEMSSG